MTQASTQATGKTVTFKRPDGKELSGYLASPAKTEGAPAVVVIQEWWGLNDQIRGVADRLAACGYLALVPDLYRGEMTVEEEEAHHLMDKLDFAVFIPELSAGVVFYGMPPLEFLDPAAIKVPVQAHWGTQDEFFPADGVDQLEAKLSEGGVDLEFHRYLAHHAFANEEAVGPGRIPGTQYDPVWAQLAMDRTLTFFGRTLWG
ncbi:carboxymethylenebutenolidase [Pseudomonas sp. NZIPFR-PS5]|nr:carboxymethylenebutenolidase [Pseudomonas sp. NZIPFR-PS5]